jgi:hypothetical protein
VLEQRVSSDGRIRNKARMMAEVLRPETIIPKPVEIKQHQEHRRKLVQDPLEEDPGLRIPRQHGSFLETATVPTHKWNRWMILIMSY